MITTGVLSGLVSGIGTIVAVASGIILGALIMYYLLKDGTRLRRSVVDQVDPTYRDEVDDFIGDACRILRDYGRGRTVMSAIVSAVVGLAALLLGLPLVFTIVVVNFIGGYIPYIGAFLGGGLAVIVALGDGGLPEAAIMLVVVLAANLALENFVEPKVMGRTLDIHPLVVLVVTALGGLLGGIVGLILAVPACVIAGDAISRLRSRGVVDRVAERAQPTVNGCSTDDRRRAGHWRDGVNHSKQRDDPAVRVGSHDGSRRKGTRPDRPQTVRRNSTRMTRHLDYDDSDDRTAAGWTGSDRVRRRDDDHQRRPQRPLRRSSPSSTTTGWCGRTAASLYLDISQWGWVHLIIGLVVLLSGIGVFSGNVLARTVGVIAAARQPDRELLLHPGLPALGHRRWSRSTCSSSGRSPPTAARCGTAEHDAPSRGLDEQEERGHDHRTHPGIRDRLPGQRPVRGSDRRGAGTAERHRPDPDRRRRVRDARRRRRRRARACPISTTSSGPSCGRRSARWSGWASPARRARWPAPSWGHRPTPDAPRVAGLVAARLLDELPDGSSALVLAIEHLWAIPLRDAVRDAGGLVLGHRYAHARGPGRPRGGRRRRGRAHGRARRGGGRRGLSPVHNRSRRFVISSSLRAAASGRGTVGRRRAGAPRRRGR